MNRRRFLFLAGGGAAGLLGLRLVLPWLLRPGPVLPLSDRAAAFVEECFDGIDRSRVWDTHVHLVGLGAGGTGCRLNPEMQSHLHPIKRLQYDFYAAAVDMQNEATADGDYVRRLLALHRQANPAGKLLLLAFDYNVAEDGTERPEQSPFFTPNEYTLRLAAIYPELVPCGSIHPYRRDAVDRLDAVAAAGARAIKWLPNAMSIDPSSPRCDAFYRRLAELNLPLITHGGGEYAVDAGQAQELGNPLRLRRALDAGVRVVIAHCASLGRSLDLDAAEAGRKQLASFDLLMRMFQQRQYEQTLFADISAVTQVNREPRILHELIKAKDLHPRLVHGSDYPLPALRVLFSTLKLRLNGLLDDRSRELCNELAGANPLLFDFALKRSLRVEEGGSVHRFSPIVFETSRLFG